MVKRRFLTGFVIVLAFMLPAGRCLADVSAQLAEAKAYVQQGEYEQAEAVYRQIAADNPGSEVGLGAQEKLTVLYIRQDKLEEADAAYQELVVAFAENPALPKALDHVADAHRQQGRYEEARQAYGWIVQRWPASENAIESQRGVVLCSILLADDGAAEAGFEYLVRHFSTHQEAPEIVDELAAEYSELRRYEKAAELYKYVVDHWPSDTQAVWSQVALAGACIVTGQKAQAEAAVEKLATDFSTEPELAIVARHVAEFCRALMEHEDKRWVQRVIDRLVVDCSERHMAKVLDHAADFYRDVKEYQKAIGLYQCVVANWPEADHAIESQTSLAKLYISLADDPNAEAAVKTLFSRFCQHQDVSEAAGHVADAYEHAGNADQAVEVYVLALENCDNAGASWGGGKYGMWIQAALVKSDILKGYDVEPNKAVERFICDYQAQPGLAEAVFLIGKGFFMRGCRYPERSAAAQDGFRKAGQVWERVISEFPNAGNCTADAYFYLASCYRRTRRHEKAIECYRELLSNWPRYEDAHLAQYKLATSYEMLCQTGAMPKDEAEPLIEQAYEEVVRKYPGCPHAAAASIKLADSSYKRGELERAIAYYEKFLIGAHPEDGQIERVKARLEELKGGQQ